ncbi:hypothetical protein AK812_SmicGene44441 [Symbiodinium microadriaticum]|uniref:Uncharacterized protein n=1 Tax=Symbiodinium microadriaticum TaxID=2951 RepID=A0A1Q9BYJ0_SYMMI|nr:hypothetical protein AK812_SmicGene44441 [Symbiodinium microadriaticum]
MCVRGFLGFLGPRSPVAVDLAAADVTSMSQYSRVALLVVMLVGALSMPFVSSFGLQFAASFQAAAGLAIPAVCALMSGGFLVCALLRGKSSDHDKEDAETATRSPMRSPADEQVEPQSYGAEERWQWNERYGMPWHDFTADVAMELTEAQSRGETLVELNIRGNRNLGRSY